MTLNPPGELPAWTVEVLDETTDHWRLLVQLTVASLHEAFSDTPGSVRIPSGLPIPGRSVLVLTEVVTIGGVLVAVNLLAGAEAAPPGALWMEARLTFERGMPGPLRARLDWGAISRTTPVSADGRAGFRNLVPPELPPESLPDLHFAVEPLPAA